MSGELNKDDSATQGKRTGPTEHQLTGNAPLDRSAISRGSSTEAGLNALTEERAARQGMEPKTTMAPTFPPPLEIKPREARPDKAPEQLFNSKNAHIHKLTIKPDGTEVIEPAEIVLNADGKQEKLPAGDYIIRFPVTKPDGTEGSDRMGRLHIPKPDPAHPDQPMPVAIALHGVLFGKLKPQDFQQQELPLDKIAGEKQFIAFYPYAESHSVDKESNPIRIWNIKNGLKAEQNFEEHAKEVGYSDDRFLAALPSVIKQIANATETGWTIIGHSNGGMAARESIASDPAFAGQFSSLVLLCTSMKNEAATPSETKIPNIYIVRTRLQSILPDPDPKPDQRDIIAAAANNGRGFLSQLGKLGQGKSTSPITNLLKTVGGLDPGLARLITDGYSPQAMVDHYISGLGKEIKWERRLADNSVQGPRSPQHFNTLDEHFDPKRDLHARGTTDSVTTAKDGKGNKVTIFNFPEGGHPVPGGDAPGAYKGFDTLALVATAIEEGQRQTSARLVEASQSRPVPMHISSFQDSKIALP